MPGAVIGGSVAGFRPTADADVTAWVAAVATNGGSVSSTRQGLITTCVQGLKADGIWTKLDRWWVEAAEDQPSGLTDWKALDLATTVNSPTFTVDRGFTGNGSTSYIDSTYNPNGSSIYQQNSAHHGVFIDVMDTAASSRVAYGGSNGSNYSAVVYYDGGGAGAITFSLNGSSSDRPSPNNVRGHHLATTGAPGGNFFNGGTLRGDAGGYVAVPSASVFILAQNVSGSPSAYSQHRISATHFGGQLTDTEVANLYSRLRTYLTAIGVS